MNTGFLQKILLSVTLILLAIFTLIYYKSGIFVEITNNKEQAVKDVSIEFTGGSITISELVPTQTVRNKIKPTSESHLIIKFKDQKGTTHNKLIDTYFEPNYQGTIYINIEPSGEINWKSNIKLW